MTVTANGKRKFVAFITAISVLSVSLCFPIAASAVSTKNQKNVDTITNTKDVPLVDNVGALNNPRPTSFTSVGYKAKVSTKINTIKASKSLTVTQDESGSFVVNNVTATAPELKTRIYLPATWKDWGDLCHVESVALAGKYLYVVVSKGRGTNKGKIVRYDYDGIVKAGLTKKGSAIAKLRLATEEQKQKRATKTQKNLIKKYIKVGPTIATGHGQSLAYNPKTNELWMWRDQEDSKGKWVNPNQARLQQISLTSLKPVKQINFKMATAWGTPIEIGHNLCFDNDGYAYFWTKSGSDGIVKIYKGTVSGSKVDFDAVQKITTRPGPVAQAIAYNPYRDTIALVADGSVMQINRDKIGELTAADFTYTTYDTKREFEGLIYDSNGYALLLVNRGPELFMATAQ